MSGPAVSTAAFHDAVDAAFFAASSLTGALAAARMADDPTDHLALIAMERAMTDGMALVEAMKRASDLVQAAQPVNDRAEAPNHAA